MLRIRMWQSLVSGVICTGYADCVELCTGNHRSSVNFMDRCFIICAKKPAGHKIIKNRANNGLLTAKKKRPYFFSVKKVKQKNHLGITFFDGISSVRHCSRKTCTFFVENKIFSSHLGEPLTGSLPFGEIPRTSHDSH